MKLVSWAQTDVGPSRAHNEDALFADPADGLFVISDGVGGANAGEVASAMFVDTVKGQLDGATGSRSETLQLIGRAMISACERINTRSRRDVACRGMGCTGIVMKIVDGRALLGHVGDRRAYLIRAGAIYQLTEDHTLVQELRNQGSLTPEEYEVFPHKSVLSRAIGVNPTVKPDLLDIEVVTGDKILLCTDGLTDPLTDDQIRRVTNELAPREAAASLIHQANTIGGTDNVSLVIIHAVGEPPRRRRRALQTEEKLHHLGNMFLFQDLSVPQVVRILRYVKERSAEPGEVLFREGEMGDELFIVVNGEAKVSKDEIFLTTIRPGGHFGELALLGDGVRSATVAAHNELKALALDRTAFYEITSEDPQLGFQLMWRFSQYLSGRLKSVSADIARIGRTGQFSSLKDED